MFELHRTVEVPVPTDPDWLATQDLSTIGPASIAVKAVINGTRPTTGLQLAAACFDGDDALLAAAGTITFDVLERVGGERVHIQDTGQQAVVTVGETSTTVELPPGAYVLRINTTAALDAAAERMRIYAKEI